ncbi:MAG TPA: glycosyl hydrolase, partial [Clostridia bacterium]|nr:glycosyl hydrolase [Clostridia bacterium]
MIDYGRFKNCPMGYRSAPFWSWNHRLETDEIIRQIRQMNEQGIGGFFMHPRGGLMDEYLGENFMKAIGAAVKEAHDLGMKAWLYDEDRYPSGSAGGMVVENNPEYGAKALEMLEVPYSQIDGMDTNLKVYLPCGDGENASYKDITIISGGDGVEKDALVWVFRIVFMHSQTNCNNKPYTDLCHKDAVAKFIEITHERYSKDLKEYFGNTIPGIFTDEPNFNVITAGKNYLPWTHEFEKSFEDRKGYCIVEHLPELFFMVGDYKKVRFDFWDVMTRLFNESFVQGVYQWCERNNLNLTGHFWEHAFPNPTHGGSVMPHYEFMQYPGIDMLFNTEEEIEQVGNDLIVKEVSSVGNQFGKERILSETFGASGWDIDFAEMKRVADWQFALGINLICQHLVLYSVEGFRKRDFPSSFLDHQPYWDSYHILGDYLARMSYIMSQGEYMADILVLHPSSSTWSEFDILEDDNPELDGISDSVKELVRTLCQSGYLFDLGDDIIIERHGRIDESGFVIGKRRYSTVILPDMTVMRESNLELLREFAQSGGKIITTGARPYLLDGNHDVGLVNFFNGDDTIKCPIDDLADSLDKLGHGRIIIEGLNGHEVRDIYSHKRVAGNKQIIFLCNYSRNEKHEIRLQLDPAMGKVESWDATGGEKQELFSYTENGKRFIDLLFYPSGSHLLILDGGCPGSTDLTDPSQSAAISKEYKLTHWKVERNDYNALTINRCSVSIDDAQWSEPGNVVALHDDIRKQLGLDPGNIFAPQPWTYTEKERKRVVPLKAKYTFKLTEHIKGDLRLAAESMDTFIVSVNGRVVENHGTIYKDRAFQVYDIK